ncbi:MAG TPA: hypothetical protein PKD55_07400 [Bellilinea sp.]|nr:hypothetical protein [Bellilinea sp.]
MPKKLRVMLEIGPKAKKTVAIAPDWPGLQRADKTEESALARLETYIPRYVKVAARAGLEKEFTSQKPWDVQERYTGNTSTDYWGISFVTAPTESCLPSAQEWERRLTLLQAAWAEFDAISQKVSVEMRRSARGGWNTRDEIIRHVWRSEADLCKKVGVNFDMAELQTPQGRAAYRGRFIDALRQYHRDGIMMVGRTRTLPYLLRHTAYHALDHAWEMEDKDMTNNAA